MIEQTGLFHHFQPIYNIQKWELIGYECLLRTSEESNPQKIFEQAIKMKKLYELDSRSIHKAFLTLNDARFSETKKLFINVYPSTLCDQRFLSYLHKIINESNINCQQLIFEIIEAEQINDFNLIKEVLHELKMMRFNIAIDDVGKDFCTMKSIIEFEPDFIKLDGYFTEDLSKVKNKKILITHLNNLCKSINSKLIVEGVENEKDLASLKSIGVEYAQGYLLGRPSDL